MGKELALFCFLHPASIENKERTLSLLDAAKPYYQDPNSKCTTWCYFTPRRTKLRANLVPKAEQDTFIAGMEIYTDKSALAIQTESSMFKDFQAKVKSEHLFEKEEELVAWYPVGGFVSRDDTAPPFGDGVLVLTAMPVAKSGQRDQLVDVLCKYAEWVKENEPDFLTYSIMIRPKAPDEVLIFERCTGPDALQRHINTPEMSESMQAAKAHMKLLRGQEWVELDNAFVGNVLGGVESTARSKL